MADVFITREHREETDFILYFKYETILCVLCGLIKSLNLGEGKQFLDERVRRVHLVFDGVNKIRL